MTQPDEPYYVMYDDDFGLSGLAGRSGDAPPLAGGDVAGDEQVGEDARSLLLSSLSEDMIRTLWLAADGARFDPAARGTTVRSWLGGWSEAFPALPPKPPKQFVKYRSTMFVGPRRPVLVEAEMRDAVLAEIAAVEGDLVRAVPLPEIVPVLRRAVAEAGADLGFRLLLRILKAHSVRVDKARYERFIELSEPFEYCFSVVSDGLHVDWPPVDPARRDSDWDFGLSELAGRFAHWCDGAADEVLRETAAGDDVREPPGMAAAVLLEDVTRLLASPLSTDTLATLWLAASDCGYRPERFDLDVRQWLERIAEVCRERLRETAPDYRPGPAPVRADLADEVLRELRDLEAEFASRTIQPHWQGVPGADAARALEQVVALADPDLGFRLFLRVLLALWMPLTKEQYGRYQALGERLGYGEFHVSLVDQFIQNDL
ncbi:contact-dependent growth inhibition system immunity protein [Streptomyces sp. HD]|uniref:contact-dependent growth inhibition system immunity protein n=1 Tax=Streptomyces sp. HD TaxID=3020892 RepID=UPI002330605C|nr:hypothetical protein [Streptomyces sp. HD]MDC0772665.1 hypothetical protein [Streptomyces sp. HD]